ncbi:hypothetical protein F2P81_009907 [Scophthalmus maximus]|uniref:Peptidase S1 domain-containing protein n=1 Tax=Scophthalmus maximus TaxID=52904 RepID=A0A6A4SSR7_SCOMX|nr:hypothetical protein F2P81_009907 [Scophthalmus maximus]
MTRLRLLLVSAWLSEYSDVRRTFIASSENAPSKCWSTCSAGKQCHEGVCLGELQTWTMYADLSGGVDGGEEITAAPVKYEDVQKRPHDIMLLKLPQATTIKPVGLPDCDKRPLTVQIAGHAATSGKPDGTRKPALSPKLHCADFNVVDCKSLIQTMLKDFPKQYKVKAYQHWICGQSPGVDVCYGDSGGGAVFRDEIYGVLSFLGDPNYEAVETTQCLENPIETSLTSVLKK